MPEGERADSFGIGGITSLAIERLATVEEHEIYPITRFANVIGYLGIVGDNLFMVACPTFTKLRVDSTFSLYKLPYGNFINYCMEINHTSKFGEISYHYIHTRRVAPLVSEIRTLQEALTLISIEVGAPLQ